MESVPEKIDVITRNVQYDQQLLLSLDIKTAPQQAARDAALKSLAEWLKTDLHELRKAFEK